MCVRSEINVTIHEHSPRYEVLSAIGRKRYAARIWQALDVATLSHERLISHSAPLESEARGDLHVDELARERLRRALTIAWFAATALRAELARVEREGEGE
jgi:hypothetical protein